ncbi:MAG: hypothetical protein AABZ60_07630 [Planctomycetota bacterium]
MLTVKAVAKQLGQIQQEIEKHLKAGHPRYLVPEPSLGWVISPNSSHYSLPYHSNSFGFRVVPAFVESGAHPLRLGFFGDSLVHGDEVNDVDCWVSRLQEKLPSIQVFNAGVPGYGTDQSLMRLEECTVPLDWVFLGLALCDETRNINILRIHRSENTAIPFMKPRFILTQNGLQKVNPPFADFHQLQENYLKPETQAFLKQYDFYYPTHPYWSQYQNKINRMFRKFRVPLSLGKNPFKLARKLTFKILERFAEYSASKNLKATVLLVPTEHELQEESSAFHEYIQEISRLKLLYWDLREAFVQKNLQAYAPSELWCPQGHFSIQTSEWIADFLAKKIKEKL